MTISLVPNDDPILSEEVPRFDFSNPPEDPIALTKQLAEFMMEKNGIGLAANQVGWRHRFFVVRSDPILACFNPVIVDMSTDTNTLEEGCLSFPGMLLKVKRANVIRIRYTQPNGETLTKQFQGMTARIMQHETDHLNGIVFLKRAGKVHLALARSKQKARI